VAESWAALRAQPARYQALRIFERPKMAPNPAALAKARKAKAPVVVAKLCRLSRDVAFISGLMASGTAAPSVVVLLWADLGLKVEPTPGLKVGN
jgi:hypothetical protein